MDTTSQLPFKDVRDFGAVGDGTTDDTRAINAALFGGGEIYFPPGTYCVTSAIEVASPVTLRGAGRTQSIIKMTTSGPVSTISVSSSNVSVFGLTIEGPKSSNAYDPKETGISARKKDSTLTDITIRDCSVLGYGYSGVELDHVTHAVLSGNHISRIGYQAIRCLSCSHIIASHNFIESVGPGEAPDYNAYGITFTHSEKTPTTENPASTHCIADANTIVDIPSWAGLDSHTGSFITFSNNQIENCRIGIHAAAVEDTNDTVCHVTITGNALVAGDSKHLHSGIIVHGNKKSYAYNVVVANNALDGYGVAGPEGGAGAIVCYCAGGAAITGNSVHHFEGAGIVLHNYNTTFVCSGNLINFAGSGSGAYAISARADHNSGVISGNCLTGLTIFNPNPTGSVYCYGNA
jgi:hypothetical protein